MIIVTRYGSTVMYLCLVASDNPLQNTRIFITFQQLGCNLHVLLLFQISKMFGEPSCLKFTVPQLFIQYVMCGSVMILNGAATKDNIIYRCFLIRPFSLSMWACVRNVDDLLDRASSVILHLAFNLSTISSSRFQSFFISLSASFISLSIFLPIHTLFIG